MSSFVHKGFSIGYQILENSFDKNVFFIHGNLASKEWWYPSMEKMQATGGSKNIIAADWRGYGDSKGLSEKSQIDFETFASDFVALMENHNMEDVHIVGHSTGGLIAMMAVLQKPELFKSLTLLDSVGSEGLILELPKEQVLAHFEKMSLDKDYSKVVLAATIKDCDPTSASFQNLFDITWKADKVMFQGVVDVLSTNIHMTEKITDIKLPTLILHGDQDTVLPLSMSEKIHSLLPNSQLKVMDNQGHSMNIENPERFVGECLTFWNSIR